MTERILHDLRLFSGVDGDVIDDAVVVIDGDVVRYAGPEADAPRRDGNVPRHDLGGAFVMPGMTDSHAHL